MYLLDVAALNAVVLFQFKNPSIVSNRLRRIKIEELAIGLITPCVRERLNDASQKNLSGCYSDLILSFKRLGFEIKKNETTNTNAAKKRCSSSICKANKNDSKYSNKCSLCFSFFCRLHCEKLETIICNDCLHS